MSGADAFIDKSYDPSNPSSTLSSGTTDAAADAYTKGSSVDPAREDREAAQSEATGRISAKEVADLGGEENIVEGGKKRGEKSAMQAERDLDGALEDAGVVGEGEEAQTY